VTEDQRADEELVREVKTGNTAAFATLVTRYQDRVFNTCWRICGHLEDARDVTQDAFVKVYERLGDFREESGFYTWLFRIAVNQAITRKRRLRTRREVNFEAGGAAMLGTQAESLARHSRGSSDEAVQGVDRGAKQRCVIEALSELNDDYRAVVVLRDIEGMDYQKIERILDVPAGTVKSRLHRARSELRAALRSKMGSNELADQ
jgi:RNA polymerase sigma-70 factor (ECF subfamily)